MKKGANINNKNNSGKTVVHDTAEKGNFTVLNHLFEKYGEKIDINDKASRGRTPLLFAAENAGFDKSNKEPVYLPIIKLLVEKKSDLTCKDIEGKTALDLVRSAKAKEAEEYLINASSAKN